MSNPSKIRLSAHQIEFVVYILEIEDPIEAVQKFAEILVEERVAPADMAKVIDRIIAKRKK